MTEANIQTFPRLVVFVWYFVGKQMTRNLSNAIPHNNKVEAYKRKIGTFPYICIVDRVKIDFCGDENNSSMTGMTGTTTNEAARSRIARHITKVSVAVHSFLVLYTWITSEFPVVPVRHSRMEMPRNTKRSVVFNPLVKGQGLVVEFSQKSGVCETVWSNRRILDCKFLLDIDKMFHWLLLMVPDKSNQTTIAARCR